MPVPWYTLVDYPRPTLLVTYSSERPACYRHLHWCSNVDTAINKNPCGITIIKSTVRGWKNLPNGPRKAKGIHIHRIAVIERRLVTSSRIYRLLLNVDQLSICFADEILIALIAIVVILNADDIHTRA